MVVVPLKKLRGGKFHNPWEDPDQMNLDEVRRVMPCWEHVVDFPVRKNISGSHSATFRGRRGTLSPRGRLSGTVSAEVPEPLGGGAVKLNEEPQQTCGAPEAAERY